LYAYLFSRAASEPTIQSKFSDSLLAHATSFTVTSKVHKSTLRGLSLRANYSDRRLSPKWCIVAGVTDPHARIPGFLDRSRYILEMLMLGGHYMQKVEMTLLR
jgi:hypothetical protein